jgi:hypothetical protein
MTRVLLGLVGLAGVASFVPAAPVPTHLMPRDPPLTFPTSVGTTWVYEGVDSERTVTITAVEVEDDGSKLVTTEYVGNDGKRTPEHVLRVSSAGVFLVSERGQPYVKPWCTLKLPYHEGQTWETNSRYGFEKVDDPGLRRAGLIEKVRVPAGEFSAARVDWERTTNGKTERRATYWFAHGVGLVRLDDDLKLKSFTPGKP